MNENKFKTELTRYVSENQNSPATVMRYLIDQHHSLNSVGLSENECARIRVLLDKALSVLKKNPKLGSKYKASMAGWISSLDEWETFKNSTSHK